MENTLLNLVCRKIHDMRKKELNCEEIRYVLAKIKSLDVGIFTGHKLSDIAPIMAKVYLEDLKKLEKYQVHEDVDIHEYMVNTIGD